MVSERMLCGFRDIDDGGASGAVVSEHRRGDLHLAEVVLERELVGCGMLA